MALERKFGQWSCQVDPNAEPIQVFQVPAYDIVVTNVSLGAELRGDGRSTLVIHHVNAQAQDGDEKTQEVAVACLTPGKASGSRLPLRSKETTYHGPSPVATSIEAVQGQPSIGVRRSRPSHSSSASASFRQPALPSQGSQREWYLAVCAYREWLQIPFARKKRSDAGVLRDLAHTVRSPILSSERAGSGYFDGQNHKIHKKRMKILKKYATQDCDPRLVHDFHGKVHEILQKVRFDRPQVLVPTAAITHVEADDARSLWQDDRLLRMGRRGQRGSTGCQKGSNYSRVQSSTTHAISAGSGFKSNEV
ncbi:hypothetical protein B0H11DRAFT_1942727 [Mycena galericulata]|nr:hypothetical protein B0H11DRAFT_1942727 [Mycena galericulata]